METNGFPRRKCSTKGFCSTSKNPSPFEDHSHHRSRSPKIIKDHRHDRLFSQPERDINKAWTPTFYESCATSEGPTQSYDWWLFITPCNHGYAYHKPQIFMCIKFIHKYTLYIKNTPSCRNDQFHREIVCVCVTCYPLRGSHSHVASWFAKTLPEFASFRPQSWRAPYGQIFFLDGGTWTSENSMCVCKLRQLLWMQLLGKVYATGMFMFHSSGALWYVNVTVSKVV